MTALRTLPADAHARVVHQLRGELGPGLVGSLVQLALLGLVGVPLSRTHSAVVRVEDGLGLLRLTLGSDLLLLEVTDAFLCFANGLPSSVELLHFSVSKSSRGSSPSNG